MTVDDLSYAVGSIPAARLLLLKGRLGNTNEERAAEQQPASALIEGLQQMIAARQQQEGNN